MSWAARRNPQQLGCFKTKTGFLFGVTYWEWIQIKLGKSFPIGWLPEGCDVDFQSRLEAQHQRTEGIRSWLPSRAINHDRQIGGRWLPTKPTVSLTHSYRGTRVPTLRTVYFAVEKDAPRIRQTDNSPQLKLEYFEEVMKDKATSRIDGVVVDVCSAQIVLQVHSGVGKGLQRQLLAMSVGKIVNTCSKLMKK